MQNNSNLPPDIQGIIKQIETKSHVTKQKALEKLELNLKCIIKDESHIIKFLHTWSNLFRKYLFCDNAATILALLQVHKHLCLYIGKDIVKILKYIIGYWFISFQSSNKTVSTLSLNIFVDTFKTTENRKNLFIKYYKDILKDIEIICNIQNLEKCRLKCDRDEIISFSFVSFLVLFEKCQLYFKQTCDFDIFVSTFRKIDANKIVNVKIVQKFPLSITNLVYIVKEFYNIHGHFLENAYNHENFVKSVSVIFLNSTNINLLSFFFKFIISIEKQGKDSILISDFKTFIGKVIRVNEPKLFNLFAKEVSECAKKDIEIIELVYNMSLEILFGSDQIKFITRNIQLKLFLYIIVNLSNAIFSLDGNSNDSKCIEMLNTLMWTFVQILIDNYNELKFIEAILQVQYSGNVIYLIISHIYMRIMTSYTYTFNDNSKDDKDLRYDYLREMKCMITRYAIDSKYILDKGNFDALCPSSKKAFTNQLTEIYIQLKTENQLECSKIEHVQYEKINYQCASLSHALTSVEIYTCMKILKDLQKPIYQFLNKMDDEFDNTICLNKLISNLNILYMNLCVSKIRNYLSVYQTFLKDPLNFYLFKFLLDQKHIVWFFRNMFEENLDIDHYLFTRLLFPFFVNVYMDDASRFYTAFDSRCSVFASMFVIKFSTDEKNDKISKPVIFEKIKNIFENQNFQYLFNNFIQFNNHLNIDTFKIYAIPIYTCLYYYSVNLPKFVELFVTIPFTECSHFIHVFSSILIYQISKFANLDKNSIYVLILDYISDVYICIQKISNLCNESFKVYKNVLRDVIFYTFTHYVFKDIACFDGKKKKCNQVYPILFAISTLSELFLNTNHILHDEMDLKFLSIFASKNFLIFLKYVFSHSTSRFSVKTDNETKSFLKKNIYVIVMRVYLIFEVVCLKMKRFSQVESLKNFFVDNLSVKGIYFECDYDFLFYCVVLSRLYVILDQKKFKLYEYFDDPKVNLLYQLYTQNLIYYCIINKLDQWLFYTDKPYVYCDLVNHESNHVNVPQGLSKFCTILLVTKLYIMKSFGNTYHLPEINKYLSKCHVLYKSLLFVLFNCSRKCGVCQKLFKYHENMYIILHEHVFGSENVFYAILASDLNCEMIELEFLQLQEKMAFDVLNYPCNELRNVKFSVDDFTACINLIKTEIRKNEDISFYKSRIFLKLLENETEILKLDSSGKKSQKSLFFSNFIDGTLIQSQTHESNIDLDREMELKHTCCKIYRDNFSKILKQLTNDSNAQFQPVANLILHFNLDYFDESIKDVKVEIYNFLYIVREALLNWPNNDNFVWIYSYFLLNLNFNSNLIEKKIIVDIIYIFILRERQSNVGFKLDFINVVKFLKGVDDGILLHALNSYSDLFISHFDCFNFTSTCNSSIICLYMPYLQAKCCTLLFNDFQKLVLLKDYDFKNQTIETYSSLYQLQKNFSKIKLKFLVGNCENKKQEFLMYIFIWDILISVINNLQEMYLIHGNLYFNCLKTCVEQCASLFNSNQIVYICVDAILKNDKLKSTHVFFVYQLFRNLIKTNPRYISMALDNVSPFCCQHFYKIYTKFKIGSFIFQSHIDKLREYICRNKSFSMNIKNKVVNTKNFILKYTISDVIITLHLSIDNLYPISNVKTTFSTNFNPSDNKIRQWVFKIEKHLKYSHTNLSMVASFLKDLFAKEFKDSSECLICFSYFDQSRRKYPDMKCPQCLKLYHQDCLKSWITQRQKNLSDSTCPHCLAKITI
ncbi:hypothetical protein A3Q56_00834 [Intoshia linei]|uniref:E3 ubiquitin-protein ligase listerin n=1 Tax=Intoshia linei TaxID=1819745 RepID=A0A177BAX9_9BILA|nr:hypothetical protein A3Q56_00834 [Intoshia linei]